MRSPALFLCFTLFAVATAFTIYDKISEQGRNDSLQLSYTKDCKCLNGRCVFHKGKQKCHCNPRHSLTDEETCHPCDCGKLGKCIFVISLTSQFSTKYEKKCICNQGSAVKDGKCVDCHCGEHSECEFDGEERTCYCLQGYVENQGVCKECNCGDYGECSFQFGIKTCKCFEGYLLNNGICEECDCGENGICKFEGETKFCECFKGYKENDGFCEECTCGENSYECHFENGEKKCSCYDGYLQKDETCVVDKCQEKCGTSNGVKCVGDPTEDKELYCACEDVDMVFVSASKECRVNMCKTKCGEMPGVNCYGDPTGDVTCGCADPNKAFVNSLKECRDCNCGENSYGCSFVGYESKTCKCKEGFAEKNGVCEVGCGIHRFCENGGTCKEGRCICLPGTRGEFCEFVPCDPFCPKNAYCTYDIQAQLANCVCVDGKRGYNPKTKICARKCYEDSMCENGGLCSGFQKFSLCECLRGTSGDICQVVDECEMNKDKCKDGAACAYDAKYQKAVCKCPSQGEIYDQQNERCRRSCSDEDENRCYNGGKCDGTFCYCLPGTSGDHCEKVDECEMKKEKCKDGAECVYDTNEQKASCLCPYDGNRYDPDSERCRGSCSDEGENRCYNGGKCDGTFCYCLPGTSGDHCEKVDECEMNKEKCKDGAKCIYDISEQKALCRCPYNGSRYDPHSERCRVTCEGIVGYCQHEGECGHNGFCKCLPGTSGDLCEKIDDCPRCSDGAYCGFDTKDRKAKCMCKEDKKSYDHKTHRCRETCLSNSVCRNGAKCHERFCECLKGTSGDFCEDVGDCVKGFCGDGHDVSCLYDVKRQIAKCDCVSSLRIFDSASKVCRTCDCGRSAINCTFRDGKKICSCLDDFTEKNGTCEKKKCTEKSCFGGKCEIVKGQEVCRCFEGYALDGDYCRKLNCTKTPCINGTCVVRRGNIEECVCPAGFTLDRDACKRGSCRPDTCFGGRCETIDGELICVCPKGFHVEGIGCYETVCKIQRCFGGKCIVKEKEEICTCREGYILVNDVCKKILCEKKSCFGGQCHLVDGQEECTCPAGYSIFEDVCRADRI